MSLSHCHFNSCFFLFFFNDTATTEIYTLSLHDALPIRSAARTPPSGCTFRTAMSAASAARTRDRKSTRLNCSHVRSSYAVSCLQKKKHRRDGGHPEVGTTGRAEVGEERGCD